MATQNSKGIQGVVVNAADDLVSLAWRAVATPSLEAQDALAVLADALLERGLVDPEMLEDLGDEGVRVVPVGEQVWTWARKHAVDPISWGISGSSLFGPEPGLYLEQPTPEPEPGLYLEDGRRLAAVGETVSVAVFREKRPETVTIEWEASLRTFRDRLPGEMIYTENRPGPHPRRSIRMTWRPDAGGAVDILVRTAAWRPGPTSGLDPVVIVTFVGEVLSRRR